MRARALIPILALLLTAPALGGEGDADAARRLGFEAMARSDWPAAARELTAAVDAFSRDGRVVELAATLEELGTVQLSGLGDPLAALATFERAAAIAERPASAWLWAALAAEQSGLPELAMVYKQRALGGTAAKPAAESAGASPMPAAAPVASGASASAETAEPIGTPANGASAIVEQPAPTASTEATASEPSAAAAAGPTPFAHFFGAQAEPAPAPAAPPTSGANDTAGPAAPPTPFAHFFGAPSGPPTASAPTADPPTSTSTAAASPPRPSSTPPAAAPSSPSAKGDAFQHFFGAKPRPVAKPDDKSPTPPTPPPPSSTPPPRIEA